MSSQLGLAAGRWRQALPAPLVQPSTLLLLWSPHLPPGAPSLWLCFWPCMKVSCHPSFVSTQGSIHWYLLQGHGASQSQLGAESREPPVGAASAECRHSAGGWDFPRLAVVPEHQECQLPYYARGGALRVPYPRQARCPDLLSTSLSLLCAGKGQAAAALEQPAPAPKGRGPHLRFRRCSCNSWLDKECVYFCHLDIIWVNTAG